MTKCEWYNLGHTCSDLLFGKFYRASKASVQYLGRLGKSNLNSSSAFVVSFSLNITSHKQLFYIPSNSFYSHITITMPGIRKSLEPTLPFHLGTTTTPKQWLVAFWLSETQLLNSCSKIMTTCPYSTERDQWTQVQTEGPLWQEGKEDWGEASRGC